MLPLLDRFEMRMTSPALFLDRDGVINHDSGYVSRPAEFRFQDGIFELCHVGMRAAWPIVVITNQSGISRGFFTENEFEALTNWMKDEFRGRQIEISKVMYATELPDNQQVEHDPIRRKPWPTMFFEAASELNIDLSRSAMVGDKETDMLASSRAGVPHRFLLADAPVSTVATQVGRSLAECRSWLEEVIRCEESLAR